MRLAEAAKFLNVTEATLERWVRQGLVAMGPSGTEPFSRADLERWARERGLPYGDTTARAPERAERLFASAVARGSVRRDVRAANASEAIRAAIWATPGLDQEDRVGVLARVLDRERLASTALGRGIALPHPREPLAGLLADPVVTILHLHAPLDWAALDGEPVRVAVLLLSPSAPVHLQLLSRVSLVLKQPGVTEMLHAGAAAQDLVARLREIEEGVSR